MLQVVPQQKIMVACDPVDFRKGIDGLIAVCKGTLGLDPYSGCVVLFRNRAMTSIKVLVFDGQGVWLCLKRWSSGRLGWWPQSPKDAESHVIRAQELLTIMYNGNAKAAKFGSDWRSVRPNTSSH